MASLDVAIRMVTQATTQDTAKNYEEAARCYREAIVGFKTVALSNNISPKVQDAILSKCALYEERLKKIDYYLLSKADLSKMFKDCAEFHERDKLNYSNSSLDGPFPGEMDDPRTRDDLLQQGLDTIEKGKRQDEKRNFPQALKYYDDGVKLMLRVAHICHLYNDERSETLLYKSLLIDERVRMIKNHLENGTPIFDRKDLVDNLDIARNDARWSKLGFDSCTASPEPFKPEMNEDEALLMEEVRSNLSLSPSRRESISSSRLSLSMSSSRHSLYPTVCEIRRFPSQDFEETKQNCLGRIPLANLDRELQLSLESFEPFLPETGRTRTSSVNSRRDSSSLRSSLNDVHLLDQQFSFENSYERDCNVTELTYENSGLDINSYKAYLNHSRHTDSGSDSGIGDPSNGSVKGPGSSATRTPTNSPTSVNSIGKISPTPSSNSGSFQDFATLFRQSNNPSSKSSKAPSPLTIMSSGPATRSSSLKRANRVCFEEELRVVSTEEVIDGQIVDKNLPTKTEVYQKTGPSERPEYIPPRALAYQPGAEDDGLSKGCYYFMACLDSFWIL